MLVKVRITEGVFSAHAEVVPFPIDPSMSQDGILRARGGSSQRVLGPEVQGGYSPRTRR